MALRKTRDRDAPCREAMQGLSIRVLAEVHRRDMVVNEARARCDPCFLALLEVLREAKRGPGRADGCPSIQIPVVLVVLVVLFVNVCSRDGASASVALRPEGSCDVAGPSTEDKDPHSPDSAALIIIALASPESPIHGLSWPCGYTKRSHQLRGAVRALCPQAARESAYRKRDVHLGELICDPLEQIHHLVRPPIVSRGRHWADSLHRRDPSPPLPDLDCERLVVQPELGVVLELF